MGGGVKILNLCDVSYEQSLLLVPQVLLCLANVSLSQNYICLTSLSLTLFLQQQMLTK